MTRYLLTIQQPDGPAPEPSVLEPLMRDVRAVDLEMREAGVWVFGGGLEAAASAVVARDALITDGPYAEGKEHVGGLTIIDVSDGEEALHWAKRLSAATTLPVEVRAFQG
ncbi:YciI family protein [Catenuloplanes sp. NPDC051500]|uniref:YciI family protein n=1 Tax=Catenuloplanes sp. NPDC051500 TaxID=3363959 RepID=UPI00379FFC6E